MREAIHEENQWEGKIFEKREAGGKPHETEKIEGPEVKGRENG